MMNNAMSIETARWDPPESWFPVERFRTDKDDARSRLLVTSISPQSHRDSARASLRANIVQGCGRKRVKSRVKWSWKRLLPPRRSYLFRSSHSRVITHIRDLSDSICGELMARRMSRGHVSDRIMRRFLSACMSIMIHRISFCAINSNNFQWLTFYFMSFWSSCHLLRFSNFTIFR